MTNLLYVITAIILVGCSGASTIAMNGSYVDCQSNQRVDCSNGILFNRSRNVLTHPQLPSMYTGSSDQLCCWTGHWVNVANASLEGKTGHVTVMTCFNEDPRHVDEVTLSFLHHSVVGEKVAWFRIHLLFTHDHTIAVCRQHYRNGTIKENKFRLNIKYPPTFLRHVIEYKALIGRMNVIDVPVYSNPVTLTRRHIRIFRKSDVTMPGHNVTDFFLRHSRRNRQDIVVRFRLFTPDDVGNYTIHVRTHHHVTSVTLILLGESPAAQGLDGKNVTIIVISVFFFLVLVAGVTWCMCNRNCTNQIGRRASRSQPSLLGMNITQSEALGDEVFLPPITLERNDPDVTPIDPKVAYVSGDSGQTGYVRPIHFSDYESDQLDSIKETHPPNITHVDPKKSQFTYDTMTGTNVQ